MRVRVCGGKGVGVRVGGTHGGLPTLMLRFMASFPTFEDRFFLRMLKRFFCASERKRVIVVMVMVVVRGRCW